MKKLFEEELRHLVGLRNDAKDRGSLVAMSVYEVALKRLDDLEAKVTNEVLEMMAKAHVQGAVNQAIHVEGAVAPIDFLQDEFDSWLKLAFPELSEAQELRLKRSRLQLLKQEVAELEAELNG